MSLKVLKLVKKRSLSNSDEDDYETRRTQNHRAAIAILRWHTSGYF